MKDEIETSDQMYKNYTTSRITKRWPMICLIK